MKFFKLFKKFENAEDGAVTVDWVVLTAAVGPAWPPSPRSAAAPAR